MARRTMRTTEWVLGTDLVSFLQNEALADYCYRSVGPGRMFATDAEWLANTRFAVIDNGYTQARFNRAIKHCETRDPRREDAVRKPLSEIPGLLPSD